MYYMYYINRAFFIATEHNRVGGRKVEWYIMQTTMVAVFTFPPSLQTPSPKQYHTHTNQTIPHALFRIFFISTECIHTYNG